MFTSALRIEEIIEAGALGYLTKNASQEEMLMGIEAVNEGRSERKLSCVTPGRGCSSCPNKKVSPFPLGT